jgi:hypothetical protein
MSRIIHYLMLLFIVFILAEIRTVLLHDIPYEKEPIKIWNESTNTPDADTFTSSPNQI